MIDLFILDFLCMSVVIVELISYDFDFGGYFGGFSGWGGCYVFEVLMVVIEEVIVVY